MILTYRYRLKDNSAKKTLRRHAFAVNQVWNYANAYQRDSLAPVEEAMHSLDFAEIEQKLERDQQKRIADRRRYGMSEY